MKDYIAVKLKVISASLVWLAALSTTFSCWATENYPTAGKTPWQRPEGAPVIEWVQHDHEWYQQSLTGIVSPYPRSLYFMDNQGNWYTPFTRPGMTGPYDLRGWHE